MYCHSYRKVVLVVEVSTVACCKVNQAIWVGHEYVNYHCDGYGGGDAMNPYEMIVLLVIIDAVLLGVIVEMRRKRS